MKLILILDVALGFLMARLRQSIVAAVGVTFGVAMFIALVSFMSGLNDLLDGLILNRTPHIRFYNEIKPSPMSTSSLSAIPFPMKMELEEFEMSLMSPSST